MDAKRCPGCDPDHPGAHRPPPHCLDLGNGEIAAIGTADDMRAAAGWLAQHYPDGTTGPRLGPTSGPVLNMTWTKLGDEFPAAARELTDAELRTHVEALCWSSLRLLDLRIPKQDVRRFAESPDAAAAIDGLAAKGWWKDLGDEWDIGLKFADWQQERRQVEHRRTYLAEAQRRSRAHRAGDHSLCLPNCPEVTRDGTRNSTVDSTVDSTRDPGRVGSGTTYPPDPPAVQNQGQDQIQNHSVANSQKPRVHDGSESTSPDAQQIPDEILTEPSHPAVTRASRRPSTARRRDERRNRILAYVRDNPHCTGNQLQAAIGGNRQVMFDTLNTLIAEGTVHRSTAAADRRVITYAAAS